MTTCSRAFLIAAVVAFAGSACSDDRPASGNDAAAKDANLVDADAEVVLPDAGPDAGDGGVVYDFCALPMFRLPISEQERHDGVSIWGDRVIFGRTIQYPTFVPSQIYLLDLATCVEEQLTTGLEVDGVNSWAENVFWSDNDTCGQQCREVYYLDLAQRTPIQLTSVAQGIFTFEPVGNSEYVVFLRVSDPQDPSQQDLVLLNLATRQEQILETADAFPVYHAVSERYVAWTATSFDPPGQGRDVFYHDLETGVTTHVADTGPGFQYAVTAGGEYLTWFGSELYLQEPYHTVLYHIPTATSTLLVDNDGAARVGRIHRNLVAYNTTRYSGELVQFPADVELYDIDSGLRRRVTESSGTIISMGLYFPRLAVVDSVASVTSANPYYFIDLVKYGITDETGHILPGDGVVADPSP